jgi:hypothetical protein
MIKRVATQALLSAFVDNDVRYVGRGRMKFGSITIENKDEGTVITLSSIDGTQLGIFTGPRVDFDKGQTLTFAGFTGYLKCEFT